MTTRRMMRHSNSGTMLDLARPFALADKEVSYVGEPVAIVIADDRYIAEDGASLVNVEYELLTPVVDCLSSSDATSPRVRAELASNVLASYRIGYGDIEKSFSGAVNIFVDEIRQHRGGAHPIECRGILVEYRNSDGSICVFASTQKAHDLKNAIASLLGLNDSRVENS